MGIVPVVKEGNGVVDGADGFGVAFCFTVESSEVMAQEAVDVFDRRGKFLADDMLHFRQYSIGRIAVGGVIIGGSAGKE